jgi:hypothetical protein
MYNYVLSQIERSQVLANSHPSHIGARSYLWWHFAARTPINCIHQDIYLKWARLNLPMEMGGAAGTFDIYNTYKSAFTASYQVCLKHTATHFPVLNDLLHSNVGDDSIRTPTITKLLWAFTTDLFGKQAQHAHSLLRRRGKWHKTSIFVQLGS